MIPRRVYLRGFLCYREEQEVDFGGATLWMLAGLNGSGKSAIFDGVTYALFGHHRGGATGAAELINKESDGFAVEFDFLLDGDLYRIKRTLRRSPKGATSATQQILRYRPPADNTKAGKWDPVPDAGRKTEFDAWVRDRVGLTFETFTSSILLLQGKSEKLLDSSPRGRFEVLAGIVDLERYAQLRRRAADERRKELKGQVESLEAQLGTLPDVDAGEVSAVEGRIAAATTERNTARANVERWQEIEIQARRWAELETKRTELERQWTQSQALLAESATIERDVDRLRDLQTALPHLEAIIKLRADREDSVKKAAALTNGRQSYREKLEAAKHALDQAQKKRASLHKSIAQDEQTQRELANRLPHLSGLVAKVELYESQDREARRLDSDLAAFPADLDADLARAQQAHDDLAMLARVLPGLARLQLARASLATANHGAADARSAELQVRAVGGQLSAELSALAPQLEAATLAREQVDQQQTAARTMLLHARDQVQSFRELAGAKVCRACGQALTAAHYEQEIAQRTAEVAAAEGRLAAAITTQQAAKDQEQLVRARHGSLERERLAKREEYRDLQRRLASARDEIGRLNRDCSDEYRALPEPFRSDVSPEAPTDWLNTTYPTAQDVATARHRVDGLESARQRLIALQRQAMQAAAVREQLSRTREQVARLAAEIAEDPAAVRRQFVACQADERALTAQLEAQRAELRENQDELDRLVQEREKVTRQIAEYDAQLAMEDTKRLQWERGHDAAMASLPVAWHVPAERGKLSELLAWKAERDELIARNTEQRAHDLRQARSDVAGLGRRRAELETDAAAIPVELRQPIAEQRLAVQAARQNAETCDGELASANQQRFILEERQAQRSRLHAQLLTAGGEHRLHELLAKLLSRDRLQLHLVRRAERQIVDHANAVLDRLSGGQLSLQLRGGEEGDEADKALELEAYNRVTGGAPINVAFLSGSQRFRVAVSLALGIGQYASRQHRPIESVIIDEGFGCLDRYGRQVMIQELQNLRGHLQCILLVSHQEDFAEAFSDGYRFELEDGTARATRIQR